MIVTQLFSSILWIEAVNPKTIDSPKSDESFQKNRLNPILYCPDPPYNTRPIHNFNYFSYFVKIIQKKMFGG